MGWHTLKHTKSGEKKCKEDKEKVIENNVIKTVIMDGVNIETLLARALYDNLADAPDELSFRKGDIVTVIERDVDGLIGWWLCLLHGKQGIVPGNRLRIIPPTQANEYVKDQAIRTPQGDVTDHGAPEFHDSSGHYDYLPPPVKAGDPLSLKEMFDIPYKKIEPSQEIYDVPRSDNVADSSEIYDVPRSEIAVHPTELYDVPRSENTVYPTEIYDVPRSEKGVVAPDEIYDVPRSDDKTIMIQDELYDIPKTENNKNRTTVNQEELYDVPKPGQEIYDIPKNQRHIEGYDTPKNKSNVNQNNHNTPINTDISTQLEGLEIYDIPVKHTEFYSAKSDLNMNIIETPGMEIYDVPTKNEPLSRPDLNEIYDVPNSKQVKTQNVFFGYDSPNNPNLSKVNEKTDIPKAESKLDIDKLMGEIYDSPFSEEPSISTIKRSPNSSKTTTPRNSMNVIPRETIHSKDPSTGQEIYDVPGVPRGLCEEIYDTPVKRLNNTPVISSAKETYLTTQVSTQDIYDIPKPHVDQSIVFQEIYDIPTSKFSRANINEPSITQSENVPKFVSPQVNASAHSNQIHEIYDTPKSLLNSYATLKTDNINTNSLEIYDVPPARQTINNGPSGEDIYDAPSSIPISIDDIPTSNNILAEREDIYDVPTYKSGKIKDLREAFISIGETKEDIYDVPANHNLKQVMGDVGAAYSSPTKPERSVLQTPDDDYVDYHDVWSKEPPNELFQEHDKSLSAPGHSGRPLSDEPKRSILDQINFDLVKELEITTTEALEQLRKLHLAVDTCVQTLLSFWSDNWLDIKNLKQTIRSIRDFSSKLKTALRLLTEFGLSTLINCTKVPRGEALMDKLIIEVEPLLESYYKIKICLLHLDSNDWKVPDSRTTQNEKFFATLNAIMILSDRIPELCKAFNLGVQNKVHELFAADPTQTPKHLTPLMSFQPTSVPVSLGERPKHCQPEVDSATLRRQTADRRQKARDSTISRPIPLIPPKPTLPNPEDRRSLSASMEPPESRRVSCSKGKHIERLVTDYLPVDNRQKKYASDPATPSCADKQKTIWGGSCPILMDRHSSVVSSSNALESLSSSSSVTASIPEETIEIKQTNNNERERMSKNFPSDSNIGVPPLSPLLHTRSASLPWDDRLKNNLSPDERAPRSPSLSPLDHRDIESLEFFCRQVESQVVLLRESMKNLTEAVENQEEPVVFVQYAKFISLTGHRVFHCGQDISERLINTDIKAKLKDDTSHLTVCIRGVVAATKTAALEYPNAGSMMEMISSVLALGDAVRIIYSVCRKALDS